MINLRLGYLSIGSHRLRLVLVLLLGQLLLLLVVKVFLVGRVVHVRSLVMAHNLIRLIGLLPAQVRHLRSVRRKIVSVAWLLHSFNCPPSILS